MRKLLLLVLALTSMSAFSRHISSEEALQAASQFMNAKAPATRGAATPLSLTRAAGNNDLQPYYVFNTENENGFIIISADDRFSKVLGYSDSGSFDLDKMPPQLKFLLENFAKKASDGSSLSSVTHPSWSAPAFNTRADEGVLLKTENWGQGAPYNGKCSPQGVYTGCVATAMAIVMKYHNWPEGYDWDAMPVDIEIGASVPANDAVAQLMSDVGQAVNMQYGYQVSGAYSYDAVAAFKNVFNYSSACEQFEKLYITDNDRWEGMLKSNLDAGNPVYYGGTDHEHQGSHVFVIDGYNSTGYHVNWGWDGFFNGYYALDNLSSDAFELGEGMTSESFNYTALSGMIVNIIPDKSGKKHSPIYVDYGGGNIPPANMPAGYNINISVSEVEKDKPFAFIVNQIHVPKSYSGEFGIALISKDDEIKEVLKSDEIKDWGYAYTTQIENHNLKFTVEIDPTDRVQLVAKRNGETEYLPVPGSNYGYSSLPVIGNTPQYAKVKVKVGKDASFYYSDNGNYYWNGEGSYYKPFGEGEHEITNVLKGSWFTPNFVTKGSLGIVPLIAKVTVTMPDGEVSVDQRGLTENIASGPLASFLVYGDFYEIECFYNTPTSSDTWEKRINLSQAGTLESYMPEGDAMVVKKLTLTGVMNATDFWYIRDHCICLTELDLSGIEKIEEVTATDTGLPLVGVAREKVWQEDFLPEYALYSQRKLETLLLPPNLKGIGKSALIYLGLNSITIPASVEKIEDRALQSNYNGRLQYITMLNPVPVEIEGTVFPSSNKPSIYVPEGSRDTYASAEIWKDFTIREGEAPVIKIYDEIIGNVWYHVENGEATIKGYYDPVEIVIPGQVEIKGETYEVTSIPNNLFNGCESLKSVVIDDQITTLGTNVFSRCANLESVTLGKGIKSLPEGTFNGCTNLQEIVIPSNIEEIASDALPLSGKLKDIKVEDGNPNFTSFEGSLYSKLEDGGLGLILMPVGKEGKAALAPDCKLVRSGAIYSSTLNSIEFNEGVEIETHGVTLRNSETVVTLPKDITLDPGAFNYCQISALVLKSTPKITSEAFTDSFILNIIMNSDEENVNLDGLVDEYITSPTIYTISTNKNFTLSAKHSVRVPFGADKNFSGYDDGDLQSMWRLSVDKANRLMKIVPLVYRDDFKITGVKVNGKEAEYKFETYILPEADDIELDIVFTVFGIENLTTHYDPDFYASLPSEDLEQNKTVAVEEIIYNCEDNGAVLTGYSGESNDIVIPEEIEVEGDIYPVIKIAPHAFREHAIESVVIPGCITEIGDYAFSGTALKEISLSAGMKLGYGAFNGCTSLETVRVNGNLEAQAEVFTGCWALKHLVVDSKDIVEIDPLFAEMPQDLSIYSPSLSANYRCSGDVVIYVPGAALEHHLATRASEVKEMWTFGLDRKNGKFEVVPELKGLTIDEVIVNGEPIEPMGNDYELPEGDNVEIKVAYTLPNGHKMETHYTPEFVSGLPNSVLQSSINVYPANYSIGTAYGFDGKFYMKGKREDVLRQLQPGIYIYRSGNRSEKIIVK